MGHSRPLFSLFSSFQYTVDRKQMFNINKFLLMTGFEPRPSGIGSEPLYQLSHTTTAQVSYLLQLSYYCCLWHAHLCDNIWHNFVKMIFWPIPSFANFSCSLWQIMLQKVYLLLPQLPPILFFYVCAPTSFVLASMLVLLFTSFTSSTILSRFYIYHLNMSVFFVFLYEYCLSVFVHSGPFVCLFARLLSRVPDTN